MEMAEMKYNIKFKLMKTQWKYLMKKNSTIIKDSYVILETLLGMPVRRKQNH
jgi:hypothetical protein